MTVYVAKTEQAIFNPKYRKSYPDLVSARKAVYAWAKAHPFEPVFFFMSKDTFNVYGEMTYHTSSRSKEMSWYRYYGVNMLHNPESTGMSDHKGWILPSGKLTTQIRR